MCDLEYIVCDSKYNMHAFVHHDVMQMCRGHRDSMLMPVEPM